MCPRDAALSADAGALLNSPGTGILTTFPSHKQHPQLSQVAFACRTGMQTFSTVQPACLLQILSISELRVAAFWCLFCGRSRG